jgi:hypothetical protein
MEEKGKNAKRSLVVCMDVVQRRFLASVRLLNAC